MPKKVAGEKKAMTEAARIVTVRIGKVTKKYPNTSRAPQAIKMIKKIANAQMGTKQVLVDSMLNAYVWNKGIKNVPKRVRVKLTRTRSADENATNKWFTVAEYVPCDSFKGKSAEVADVDAE